MLTVARDNKQHRLLVTSLVESYYRMHGDSPQANPRAFLLICQMLRATTTTTSSGFIDNVYHDMQSHAQATGLQHILRTALQTIRDPHYQATLSLCSDFHGNEQQNIQPPCPSSTPSPCSILDHASENDEEHLLFNLSVQNSRYQNDFVEIGMLGRGGFASVWRARNKLDGIEYAIKKIRLARRNPTIFREIKHLARLEHRNIVRYYSSWLQVTSSTVHEQEDEEEEIPSSVFNNDSKRDQTLWMNMPDMLSDMTLDTTHSTSSHIQFGYDTSNNSTTSLSSKKENTLPPSINKETSPKSYAQQHHQEWTLYIQMQLCPSTLHDYIKLRNQKSTCDLLDSERNLEIFSQILEGAAYIHEQGIIHRDLKPTNIFLSMPASFHEQRKGRRRSRANSLASVSSPHLDNDPVPVWDEQPWVPKIGDFGLAAASFSLPSPDEYEHLYNISASPSLANNNRRRRRMSFHHTTRTSGVGTMTYASPEQLAKAPSAYDEKVDIYSLGIIFFEMLQPFSTCMERAEAIEGLKQGIFPSGFVERYPREAALILWMMDTDPEKRPTAAQLLECELFVVADDPTDAFTILQSQLLAKSLELEKKAQEIMTLRQRVELVESTRKRQVDEMTHRLIELEQKLALVQQP
ncbi:kinase-like protein [Lichtheimia hyalospora FSU 10163]|nr:kinase-like protein [Lichtheimia hyalospora FSU 10163]